MNSSSLIVDHFRLVDSQKKALKKLGIATIEDLLYYFPARYGDTAQIKNIVDLITGEEAVIFGKVGKLKTKKAFVRKIPMSEAIITDETGSIKAIWFHQPYIAKMLADGAAVKVAGKISEKNGVFAMINPKIETVSSVPISVGDSLFGKNGKEATLYPVYPESRGITSNWIYHAIQKIFSAQGGSASLAASGAAEGGQAGGKRFLDSLTDPLPAVLLKKYSLPVLKTAFIWIHSPKKETDALAARKRFAFQEIFFIQLEKQKERKTYEKKPSFKIENKEKDVENFVKRFAFELTSAQKKAIGHILDDFKKNHAMSRLLEGDVGSGKTAVAAAAVYAAVTTRPENKDFGNLQAAYMCPTEILAEQHFESFVKYFSHLPINIALITGSITKKFPSKTDPTKATPIAKNQLIKWIANGEIPILIGTHALIQKQVIFKNLAYIIIDEQHRFGTAQRQKLRRKDDRVPHLLSMTATPIPRTLALTIYGDLDLTLLDEMPPGRKPIITEIVLPNKRKETYEKILVEIKDGRQVYVICPRIDLPDPTKELALNVKSVKEEAKRLQKDIFPEANIEILHSKIPTATKTKIMDDFKSGAIDILVSTSVVEVGVNVPNATVIVVEGAERFGLAQLHQLRGRVLRSNHQAYCFVFADTKTEKTLERLKALKTAKNGFELAELDLAQRGAGELRGKKQWGITDLAMEGIKNIKMVEAARLEARAIIESDPNLANYPILKQKIDAETHKIHFE